MMKTSSGKSLVVLFICIIFVLTACTPSASRQAAPRVVKGQIDLTQWNFAADGPVKLSGEWEFHWEKLLRADENLSGEPHEGATFIQVPGIWNGHLVGSSKIAGSGYATYRLKVFIKPVQGGPARLQVSHHGHCLQDLFVNGKEVSADGIPGTTRESMVPEWNPHIATFTPGEGNYLEIILHISNFHHRKGGAVGAIHLGREKDICAMREKKLAFELFLCGSIFIMGLYHLFLFLVRQGETGRLSISAWSACSSPCRVPLRRALFCLTFPGTDWAFRVRLTNLTSFISVPVFLLYIRSLLPR